MKRQHKSKPQSVRVPVPLIWRKPRRLCAIHGDVSPCTSCPQCGNSVHVTDCAELPGPVWGIVCNGEGERPSAEDIEAAKLSAWFMCSQCKSERPTPKGYGTAGYCGGTGYGNDSTTDAPVCYKCCGENERKSMAETGRATLYLTRNADAPTAQERGEHWHADAQTGRNGYGRTRAHLRAQDWSVSNWPGSLKLPAMSIKRNAHNWRDVERVDVWFIFGGYVWHGVNLGDSQILRARRTLTEWRQRPHGDGYHAVTPRKSRAKPNARRACTTCGKAIEVRENSRAHLATVYPCHDCATLARLSAT